VKFDFQAKKWTQNKEGCNAVHGRVFESGRKKQVKAKVT
jgi:hypothetical protein